jgi:hypothetical protein
MTADPPVRTDGRCVVCDKPRSPWRSKRYGKLEAERDPFCSSTCCRVWHGVSLRATPSTSGPTSPKPRIIRHGTERGYKDGCRCDSCTWAATTARRKRRLKQEEQAA